MVWAINPAPNPLSILTTLTPLAQLLSMARRADNPSNLAPCPIYIESKITGLSTSPPTTEARAPSIPAQTTKTFAL